MNEFEQILDRWKQKQQQQQQKIIKRAKPVLQSYVDRGVNQVEIQYSGSGDTGCVSDIIIILKPTKEMPEDEDYEILEELAYECTVKSLSLANKDGKFISPYLLPLVDRKDCPQKRDRLNRVAIKNATYPLTRYHLINGFKTPP